MPTPLLKIFYVSCCADSIGTDEVHDLVARSQRTNRRADITGVLVYTGRHFAQALEGHPADVVPLMQAIKADPRHGGMRVLVRHSESSDRDYDGWAMHLHHRPDLDDSLRRLLDAPAGDAGALAAQALEGIAAPPARAATEPVRLGAA